MSKSRRRENFVSASGRFKIARFVKHGPRLSRYQKLLLKKGAVAQ